MSPQSLSPWLIKVQPGLTFNKRLVDACLVEPEIGLKNVHSNAWFWTHKPHLSHTMQFPVNASNISEAFKAKSEKPKHSPKN